MMILTPYRSPPYRTPSPANSSSPPHGPSPKRKRDSSLELASDDVLLIDTTLQSEDRKMNETDSPRTRVAEKFKDLNIRQVQPAKLSHAARRKRLKRNAHLGDNWSSSDTTIEQTSPVNNHQTGQPPEIWINETPDCRTKTLSSPLPSSEGYPFLTIPVVTRKEQQSTLPSWSPPPKLPDSPTSTKQLIERSGSPLPSAEDITPDQAALTWQDNEITGHEIDIGGDDDGEGINGVGFRPTAAIAYARQQKRKQQVSEWKAREARDARQRRVERRRGTVVRSAEEQSLTHNAWKRTVRFAGVG